MTDQHTDHRPEWQRELTAAADHERAALRALAILHEEFDAFRITDNGARLAAAAQVHATLALALEVRDLRRDLVHLLGNR